MADWGGMSPYIEAISRQQAAEMGAEGAKITHPFLRGLSLFFDW
jgi:hypothetical protein